MSSKILSVVSETFKDANDSIAVISAFVKIQITNAFKNDGVTGIDVIVNHHNGNNIKMQIVIQLGKAEELVAIKDMEKVEAWISGDFTNDRIWNLLEKLKLTLKDL